MKYFHNRVQHNPPETYGDCVRACVASILELEPEFVPHFFHDGAADGFDRLREWLKGCGFGLVWFVYDGSIAWNKFCEVWGEMNPGVPVILLASVASGDHAVIMVSDKIEHDPAWIKSPIIGPNSNGHWNILVIAKT